MDFRAAFCGMTQQHLIKITACDLIGVIGLRTIAVLEVKLGSSFRARADDFAPVLFYEPGAQEFLVQPKPGKRFHAERQQRFADVKPRKLFPLKENDAPSGPREQRCCSATGRPASYDCAIIQADT